MAAKKHVLDGAAADAFNKLLEHQADLREYLDEVDRAWRAYEGVAELRSKAVSKTNKLTPPYVMHIIETMLAAMLDPKLRFKVRPRPRLYDPGELEDAWVGAKAHQDLLGFQLDMARFDEKKRAFVLQERVAGLSVMKVWWYTSERMKTRLSEEAVMGTTLTRLTEEEAPWTVFDGPRMDVIDLHDMVWDLSAPDFERCGFMAQRILMTKQEVEDMQTAGIYKNVDLLYESVSAEDQTRRESKTKKFKDRIEIWEIWERQKGGKIRVYSVGNQNVLLNERDSPYWHGEMPFVFFSAQSKPFRLVGTSQVNKLAALQEMLWSVSNSRLDALEFANLGMALIRDDRDDPYSFQWESGAVNMVANPQEVQLWTPDPTASSVSIPAEQMIKQDMQNLAGGQPFTSTSEARVSQANTATEASLVANIAQQNLSSAKTVLNYAFRRMGQQMMELNKQYVRDAIAVKVLDIDQPAERDKIMPMMLQGEYLFDPEPQDESLLRQEKRAEQMALFNSVIQAAPIATALAAQGGMRPVDYDRVFKDLFESYDKDAELYFKAAPPPQPVPGQPQGADPMQQAQGQQGVTNPQLAAGMQSPANGNSMSPVSGLQQFLAAAQGGGRR